VNNQLTLVQMELLLGLSRARRLGLSEPGLGVPWKALQRRRGTQPPEEVKFSHPAKRLAALGLVERNNMSGSRMTTHAKLTRKGQDVVRELGG
jgi:hypothetical protein